MGDSGVGVCYDGESKLLSLLNATYSAIYWQGIFISLQVLAPKTGYGLFWL